jgi:uncharacterized membrane protein YkoI
MRNRTKIGAGVVLVAALAGGSAAWATAGGDDETLTGSTLERASAAALRHTGGGSVTEAEVGDDGAAYEVEVRLSDGRRVELELGADFTVLGREADDDGNDRDEPGGDD